MKLRFEKHYTREEAQALLPQVRQWLDRLGSLHANLQKLDQRLETLMAPGCDVGGEAGNDWARTLAGLKEILMEFHRREIQIKDFERGLIDFPAIRDGREVFLCWERDEEAIEFWHDLDAGYAGRERL